MIEQIEDAIVERIKAKLTASAGIVAVQKGVDGIPQPAVYVSTEAGEMECISQSTFRHDLTIFVDIVFSHLSGERERRRGVYLILEGVLQALLLQKLSLAITPIRPRNWRNTTTEELRKKGLIAFSLELATSFTMSRVDDETLTDLITVGLAYFLQDPADDNEIDAEDTITFEPA